MSRFPVDPEVKQSCILGPSLLNTYIGKILGKVGDHTSYGESVSNKLKLQTLSLPMVAQSLLSPWKCCDDSLGAACGG